MGSPTHKGRIRFITENTKRAIVEEFTLAGYESLSPERHTVLGANFSGKNREDIISYHYDLSSGENDIIID